MKVVTVPVRQDNYAYLLIDEPSNVAAAVDVYDVEKVAREAESLGVKVVAAITTHHHHDHSGGNKDFAAKFPNAPIYGGSNKVEAVTHVVLDNEEWTLGENTQIKCLATPCHTQDSICYYVTDGRDRVVFTGDTLFSAGCGRFFEGTAHEMIRALSLLGSLPDDTTTYVGHEYTAGNLAFAQFIEPENESLRELDHLVKNNRITSGLTSVGDEKRWNVFMRLGSGAVRKAVNADASANENDVMNSLRQIKNSF